MTFKHLLVPALLGLITGASVAATTSPAPAPVATLSVDVDRLGPYGVRPSQQGFSFESEELVNPNFTSHALFGFLANLGEEGVVRIGGNSSDEQLWTTTNETFQSVGGTWPINPSVNATIVKPANIVALADAVHATGWRIVFGVDLKHYDPNRAASEAAFVDDRLGAALVGIAIGNEANYYVTDGTQYAQKFSAYAAAMHQLRSATLLVGSEMGSGAGIHGQQFFAYEFAQSLNPGIAPYDNSNDAAINAIVGNPGAAASEGGGGASNASAVSAAAATPPSGGDALLGSMAAFSAHYYPESACSAAGTPTSPSDMLSPATQAAVHGKVLWLTEEAREVGLPAYLDETNTVNCQGASGISNSYATTLYSLDLLLTAAQAGVASVNLHSTIGPCGGTKAGDPGTTGGYYLYTPFCYANHAAEVAARTAPTPDLIAQPILFGAKVFRELKTGQFVASSYTGPSYIRAYSIRDRSSALKIVLIDTRDPATAGAAPSGIAIRVGRGFALASTKVLMTTDPKGLASIDPSRITFGGSGIANDGTWTAPPLPSRLQFVRGGTLTAQLSAGTVQIITIIR